MRRCVIFWNRCGGGEWKKRPDRGLPDRRKDGNLGETSKEPEKYISSFLGFAPADDPQVIALITIDEPEGIYYGGTIAAPVIRDLFEVILPYLGVEKRG